jgi:hypothetical protein
LREPFFANLINNNIISIFILTTFPEAWMSKVADINIFTRQQFETIFIVIIIPIVKVDKNSFPVIFESKIYLSNFAEITDIENR